MWIDTYQKKEKKAEVAVLVSGLNLKIRNITRDKEKYLPAIELFHNKNKTSQNVYRFNKSLKIHEAKLIEINGTIHKYSKVIFTFFFQKLD